MLRKRIQLGLIHAAVAMTLVPINSTLNRVMIKEMAVSATLVAFLASLPYLFSPIQVAIGSFSDRHPVFGFRRTPYIFLGLMLTAIGVVISPQAAFMLDTHRTQGVLMGLLAFGAWGMGYNFASVSYLSLASELSGEKGRGRTIAVMWFMMITSIILTSILLSQLVDPYTPQALIRSFLIVGSAALSLGLIGLLKLESRQQAEGEAAHQDASWATTIRKVLVNPQAKIFFAYLTILLAAILGQDILLEPYGAEAFNLSVKATTRITSIWGVCVLAALLVAGIMENRVGKRMVAQIGGGTALLGFILIAASGSVSSLGVFYLGVVFLGVGTGLATVSNLSLMLDMTTVSNAGLYIGAWGVANAMSRFIGTMLGGVVRDVIDLATQNPVGAYMVVFSIEAFLLIVSLVMLRRINVSAFKRKAQEPSLVERASLAMEV